MSDKPRSMVAKFGKVIATVGQPMPHGADSDDVENLVDPWDGADGKPLSGEEGVSPARTEPEQPVEISEGPFTVTTAPDTDKPILVTHEQPTSWAARKVVTVQVTPIRIADANPLRMSITVKDGNATGVAFGDVVIGESESEVESQFGGAHPDTVGEMTHTAEVWAMSTTAPATLWVHETFRNDMVRYQPFNRD